MTHFNLGNTLLEQNNCDAAIESYQPALELDASHANGYNNLANALRAQGKPDRAIENYRKALALQPDSSDVHSNMLFTMLSASSYSPADLFAEHERYAHQFEAPLKPLWIPHRNVRDPNKRLRVGYVSGDFREHALAYFFEPIRCIVVGCAD
jgi:tetratricopeptide (TPR) repeat protein